MNDFGEFDSKGVVLSNSEMRQQRRKRGECERCGNKCFKKTLFKSIPITDDGNVLNGRCLRCYPIEDETSGENIPPIKLGLEDEKKERKFVRDDTLQRSLTRSLSLRDQSKKIEGRPLRKVASVGNVSRIIEETEIELMSDSHRLTPSISNEKIQSSNRISPDRQRSTPQSTAASRMVNQAVGITAALQLQKNFKTRKAAREQSITKTNEQRRNSVNETKEEPPVQGTNKYLEAIGKLDHSEKCSYREAIEILQEYPSDLIIFQKVTNRLSEMDLTSSIDQVTHKSVNMIFSGMKSFSENRDIQYNAILTLRNLLKKIEDKDMTTIVASGMGLMVDTLERFPRDSQIQKVITNILFHLSRSDENQSQILKYGGIQKVVEVMANHSGDIEIQETCCKMLRNLSSGDHLIKDAIYNAKGTAQIAVAIVLYPDIIGFLEIAIHALYLLCEGHGGDTIKIIESGAIIDAVVSTMHLHRDELTIQKYGVSTLYALSYSFDSASIIGNSGGIDVIVRAMWVHPKEINIQLWSCRAMSRLSVDMNNSVLFVSIGGSSAIVNTMQTFSEDPIIQIECCDILSKIGAVDDQIKIQLVQDEVIDAITLAMVLHDDNVHVQETACLAIQSLTCESNVDSLLAANVSELMSTAASKFPTQCQGAYSFMMSTVYSSVEDDLGDMGTSL